MPYINSTDGVSLFFRDWGDGQPVLFCSSWALSSIQWQYQMITLAEAGKRCIAYDRRGHGRSDDPGRGYGYDTLADDLANLIEQLDLQDLTLVAHSMSGGEVVRYLTRHGNRRVARVLFLAPTLPFPLKTAANPAGIEPAAFDAVHAQWRSDFGKWTSENEGAYFGDGLPGCHVSELTRAWTRADLLSTSLLAVLECGQALSQTDFREELSAVEVPTLVIHGDHDASAPLELCGARVAELVPGSRLVIYESAPHGLYLTHRSRLDRDLLAFIECERKAGASPARIDLQRGDAAWLSRHQGSHARA
jgi:non-heme chloroperoxidase